MPNARVPFHEASRVLLRSTILDAMRELLHERDWSAVTMSDVARAAGISRQTLYKEFSSRQGLAQGYALRLVDEFVDAVADSVYAHVGDARAALVDGFTFFFEASAADPLVQSLLSGEAKPDLLRLITTDAAPSSSGARVASQRPSTTAGSQRPNPTRGSSRALSCGSR